MTLIEQWMDGTLEQPLPLRATGVISAQCNLACQHCYWSHDLREKTARDWSNSANTLARFNTPLLYAGRMVTKEGLRFLERCAESGVSEFHVVDHGYTIFNAPEEWLRRFTSIDISIDGEKDSHERQRNKSGSFEVAWNAVIRLKEMGLDPIISTAFSPLTFDGWERFERRLEEHDIPMSTTLVSAISQATAERGGDAVFTDPATLRSAFRTLLEGKPKLINLYDLSQVEALMADLRELYWECDAFAGDAFVARYGDTRVVYRPESVLLAGELLVKWDGKFHPPIPSVRDTPIDPERLPAWYLHDIKQKNAREREVWAHIITLNHRKEVMT